MNKMEKYFKEYSSEIEEYGPDPGITEKEFLVRYASEKRRSFLRRAVISSLSVAAAVSAVAVSLLFMGRGDRPDPAELYVQEYHEGLKAICDDIRYMESESGVCREMGISSTVDALLASSESFSRQMAGTDGTFREEMVRKYCIRQRECIAGLYRDCLQAYSKDRGER